MKALVLIYFIFCTIYAFSQEHNESSPLQGNETISDKYLPPSKNAKRIIPVNIVQRPFSNTLSSIFTRQVNVDSSGHNILLDAANEPNIAISPANPKSMVIGWRQFDNVLSNFRQAGYSYSSDSGQTWAAGDVIQRGVFRSDPVLDCDAAGNFYYNSLTRDTSGNFSCHVFKSINGGMTWDNGTLAHGGDKQWMAIDKTNGAGAGNIYSAWSFFNSSCSSNDFTRSVSGGAYYDSCSFIEGEPYYGTMDIDDNGSLYVSGLRQTDSIVVSISSTAQLSSSVPSWNSSYIYFDKAGTSSSINPAGLIGQVNVAVDHSPGANGNIYVCLAESRVSNGDSADVIFSRSTNGGLTWSQPMKVNDDIGINTQWLATLSVSPNGRIDIVWLDTRDSGGNLSALYYSYSYDQGMTWSPNERMSALFDPHVGYPNQDKMGDYFDMISDNTGANLAWCNTLNGEEDIYYSYIVPPAITNIATNTFQSATIYPNPAVSKIYFSARENIKDIKLFSVIGSQLFSKEIHAMNGELDLSTLSKGIYYLRINYENGFIFTQSVIKE